MENQLNNLHLGYTYGRDQDNSPLLKMISPNMCRVGRINERALDGPMRLPTGGGELLKEVQKLYNSWFKIWRVSYVPKLLYQPKWFKLESDLKEGDVVMFQKTDSALDGSWSLGNVDQLILSRDGLARRAILKYQNYKEDFPRTTDRQIRSVVKVWSIDDVNVDDDLAELQRRLKKSSSVAEQLGQLASAGHDPQLSLPTQQDVTTPQGVFCRACCCRSHCSIGHNAVQRGASSVVKTLLSHITVHPVPEAGLVLHAQVEDGVIGDEEEKEIQTDSCKCSLTKLMKNLDLNLE